MTTDTDVLKELDFDLPCGIHEHREPTPANYYVRRCCPGCGARTAAYLCHACWIGNRLMRSVCTLCGTWAMFETTVTNRDQIKDLQ